MAPEARCSPYRRSHYRYPPSVEARIVEAMEGRIYAPYSGRYHRSMRETHIEHSVALSEAHDSGLCRASRRTRRRFGRDLVNLTLADPDLNRSKGARDAAEWLPPFNRCWFADRIVKVRRKYKLTIDRREARALDAVLNACESVEMVFR